ncbi:hypothetical protein ACFSHQ_24850 [Gemmobacter lanyuensis]
MIPEIIFTSVDFPAPLSPRRPTTSLRPMWKFMLSSAVKDP